MEYQLKIESTRISRIAPPRSLFVRGDSAFVCLIRSKGGEADVLFIPPPVEREKAKEVASAIAPNSVLFREFLENFSGIREELPDAAGYFMGSSILRFSERYETGKWCEGWESAAIIYHSSTGNCVLMQRDGSTAWCKFAAQKIEPLYKNLDKFLIHYADYKKSLYPFDAYGPPLGSD